MSTKNEEKKDLATQKTNFDLDMFADYASDVTGLESVDQTDLKLPKIKLVQMTSEEFTQGGITPGYFYNTITKEATPEIECILLALGKSRVMWPAQFKRGDKPLCRSFDAKKKTEGIGDGDCSKCEYAVWPADGTKPPCTQGYIWLGLDKENTPFRISMQGASVAPTKDFLNAIVPKLSRGGKHLGVFVFKIRITSEKQTNDKGAYFIAKYEIVGTIEQNDYKTLEDMSMSLRELFLQAIDKDTTVIDAEDVGGEVNSAADVADNANTGKTGNGVLF